MSAIFIKIINMSLIASVCLAVVLLLRLILVKSSKRLTVLLWALVAVRLVLPFSIESPVSVIFNTEPIRQSIITDSKPDTLIDSTNTDNALNSNVNPSTKAPASSGFNTKTITEIAAIIWAIGVILMLTYAIVSYVLLSVKMRTAVRLKDNIFQSEHVKSPFVLGIIRPKIMLPFNMSFADEELFIAHERGHISRLDHISKPIAFLLLSIHWFNPFMWLGFSLFCKDIELACDEKVIGSLTAERRIDYSQALLNSVANHRAVNACPIAFAEVGIKSRVKSVLSYKKPTFWVIIVTALILITASVLLLTNLQSSTLGTIEQLSMVDAISNKKFNVHLGDELLHTKVGKISGELLRDIIGINLSKKPVSDYRDDSRSKVNTIAFEVLNDSYSFESSTLSYPTYLYHFNADFTEVWLNNDTKPTLSYSVKNPEEARRIYELLTKLSIKSDGIEYDRMIHDIDFDGDYELCIIEDGRTSGVLSIKISVIGEGGVECSNVFTSGNYGFFQFTESSGKLKIAFVDQAGDSKTVGVNVEGETVVIDSDEFQALGWK